MKKMISILILIATLSVHAQWSGDPNANNAICTVSGRQRVRNIVSDGSRGAIMVWLDERSTTNFEIYAQRIDSNGLVQWTTNGVAILTGVSGPILFDYFDIASDGLGGAIITWADYRNGTNYDIFAQRINAGGVVQWAANGVPISAESGDQIGPKIISDGLESAIITWADLRNGTNSDIYAQLINASGIVQWTTNGVAISTESGDQLISAIVSDNSRGAVILWFDYRNGTDYDIYAQRINTSGVVQWMTNGVAINIESGNQISNTIISDGLEGAIITWSTRRNPASLDIYAQRINASGVVQWTTNGVAISTESGDQWRPTITSDGSGGSIIAWEDRRSGLHYDIYAQRISADGVMLWMANGVAISIVSDNQVKPTVTSDSSGGAIILWEDSRGLSVDIYAQRINESGIVQWTANGVAISTASEQQLLPIIISDGSGSGIITWTDYRSGPSSSDIYAQRVRADGSLGGITSVDNETAPYEFMLEQNYPNPFNPSTKIQYQVSSNAHLSLKVYDVLGNEVTTLVDEEKPAGIYKVDFNANGLSSGIYFYQLRADNFIETKKMAIIK